jgi:3-oxoadipate enol-lactonase
MRIMDLGDIRLHWRADGDPGGAPIVFLNSLGTDLRLWDKTVAALPPGWRAIRMDKRGHGLSDCPRGPYSMGALIRDAERVIDGAGVRGAVIVGCSIGGMIAQGLAVKRPDLARALVLSNTGARIGTAAMWAERIAAVEAGGIEAIADAVMARWFAPAFRASPEATGWRHMLTRTPAAGYAGCCAAIAGADFLTTTARLTLPTLAIAGSEDGSTPPDLVRETAALIAGSRFVLIRGAGHLPCVEAPEAFSAALAGFLAELPA